MTGRQPLLDEVTYRRLTAALNRAKYSGASVPEYLNREGHLWTPLRERQVRAEAMRFVLLELKSWRPAEFLRSVNRTLESASPEEMYRAIVAWMEKHVEYALKEGK